MLQQTGEKDEQKSNTSNSSEETHKQESNSRIRKIENTPFSIIETDNSKYFLAMGAYRLTEEYNTEDEALEYTVANFWNLAVTVISVITEMTLAKQKEEDTKRKKEN